MIGQWNTRRGKRKFAKTINMEVVNIARRIENELRTSDSNAAAADVDDDIGSNMGGSSSVAEVEDDIQADVQHDIDSNSDVSGSMEEMQDDNVEGSSDNDLSNEDNESDDIVICRNCKRSGPCVYSDDNCNDVDLYLQLSFVPTPFDNIEYRRKFCLFNQSEVEREGEDTVWLCTQCFRAVSYIVGQTTNQHLSPLHCWPAFMWSLLKDPASQSQLGIDLWKLFPRLWRSWWIDSARNIRSMEDITMDQPEAYFAEITEQKNKLADSIQGLEWVELVAAVDKFASLPVVRCPWGCSCFMNHTCHVPLDAILGTLIRDQRNVKWMSRKDDRSFADHIRYDFCQVKVPILHNSLWLCQASIAFDSKKGPVVLTCEFHDKNSTGMYLHVPRHPTGTISSNADDQYTPCVVIPRTVHKVRAKAYSNAFQMNEMTGHYEGVDSVTLCNMGKYNIGTKVSDVRDSLSIAARSDMASHVDLLERQNVIPRWLSESKLQRAKDTFTEDRIQDIREEFCKGATYISMKDAIELERSMKQGTEKLVYSSDGHAIHFRSNWPPILTYAHRNDEHGAKVPKLPKMSNTEVMDMRSLWIVVATVVLVPTLWNLTFESLVSVDDWHGWLLAFASRKCLSHHKVHGSRNNPFRKNIKDLKLLQTKLISFAVNGTYDVKVVANLFDQVDHVAVKTLEEFQSGIVQESMESDGDDHSEDYDASDDQLEDSRLTSVFRNKTSQATQAVVLFNDIASDSEPCSLPMQHIDQAGNTWQLVLVLATELKGSNSFTGSAYCRHGGQSLDGWWLQTHGDSQKSHPVPISSDIPTTVLEEFWDLSVYINLSQKSMTALRDDYLVSCGGQIAAQCLVHQTPLVISSIGAETVCCSCDEMAYYTCPFPRCDAGLCKEHFKSVEECYVTGNVSYISPTHLDAVMNDNLDVGFETDDDYSNEGDDLDSSEDEIVDEDVSEDDGDYESNTKDEREEGDEDDEFHASSWKSNSATQQFDGEDIDMNDEYYRDDDDSSAGSFIDGPNDGYHAHYQYFEEDSVDVDVMHSVHEDVDLQLLSNEDKLITYGRFETGHLEPDKDFEDSGHPSTIPTTESG